MLIHWRMRRWILKSRRLPHLSDQRLDERYLFVFILDWIFPASASASVCAMCTVRGLRAFWATGGRSRTTFLFQRHSLTRPGVDVDVTSQWLSFAGCVHCEQAHGCPSESVVPLLLYHWKGHRAAITPLLRVQRLVQRCMWPLDQWPAVHCLACAQQCNVAARNWVLCSAQNYYCR